MTATAQDIEKIRGKQQTDLAQIVYAARESGRSPFAIMFDYLGLRRKQRGKLRFYEYMLYGLYDKKKWTEEDRGRFISAHVHWPITNACNDRNWWAVTEDKWLSSVFLKQGGIPIPENKAVFDRGMQLYPDVPKLQSAEDLKTFFQSCKTYPLFAKPVNGIWSAGALRISSRTETHVVVDGSDALTYEDLADKVIADQPYLFQTCLKPHKFFEGITNAIATVRCVNIMHQGHLKVPYTLLKLPRKDNVADNFWRPGNVLCDLDPETGEVRTIVMSQNGRRSTLDALPEGGRTLIGETLPFWQELKELNERVALLHAANRYGSTDITLTEEGPVIVEVNTGCAFELMQMASGQGLLTDEMSDFFRDCGADI